MTEKKKHEPFTIYAIGQEEYETIMTRIQVAFPPGSILKKIREACKDHSGDS